MATCETIYEELCLDQVDGYTTTEVCDTWPKDICSVSKKKTKKVKPVTSCRKVPKELCAPAGCGVKEGQEECFDKTVTSVYDRPVESCTLDPQRRCKFVTVLVPYLEPVDFCLEVPKEVCFRLFKANPKKVKKPIIKKWCYVPTQESGLA